MRQKYVQTDNVGYNEGGYKKWILRKNSFIKMKKLFDNFVNGQGIALCYWFYTDNSEANERSNRENKIMIKLVFQVK